MGCGLSNSSLRLVDKHLASRPTGTSPVIFQNHTYTLPDASDGWEGYCAKRHLFRTDNGWGPTIGTEAQLDGNSSGVAIHEWIDKMTLTVW